VTPKNANQKPNDAEQSKRFKEAARQLEADVTGKTFEKALGILTPLPEKKRSKVKAVPSA
jgi:hypothetical protein